MTAFLITMTQGRDLLHLYPFEVEATDEADARRKADNHMTRWRNYILPGAVGGVPRRWEIESVAAFDRPPLTRSNHRAGAPDVDNPVAISLGDLVIARLTMDRFIEGRSDQTMRLASDDARLTALDGREFVGPPGVCVSDALAAVRAEIGS
ncbi:MAG TPA: hypothetical protein VK634_19730 [Reyranella sp.]|nr:hypothetical protein [Reyranella sp.]HTE82926.1 hypothetical protein [Reyranella sp.]